jgi:hypothetical protein
MRIRRFLALMSLGVCVVAGCQKAEPPSASSQPAAAPAPAAARTIAELSFRHRTGFVYRQRSTIKLFAVEALDRFICILATHDDKAESF